MHFVQSMPKDLPNFVWISVCEQTKCHLNQESVNKLLKFLKIMGTLAKVTMNHLYISSEKVEHCSAKVIQWMSVIRTSLGIAYNDLYPEKNQWNRLQMIGNSSYNIH